MTAQSVVRNTTLNLPTGIVVIVTRESEPTQLLTDDDTDICIIENAALGEAFADWMATNGNNIQLLADQLQCWIDATTTPWPDSTRYLPIIQVPRSLFQPEKLPHSPN